MNKVYVYKEYGIYDYDEFCLVKVFKDIEKAKELLKENTKRELEKIESWGRQVVYDLDKNSDVECYDGDICVHTMRDDYFGCYEYGYGCEYSLTMKVEEMGVIE
jgi:hypothetical protein